SQFPIPHSQFPIPNSQFPIPNNRKSGLWKNLWTNHPDFVENFTRSPKRIFAQKWGGDRQYQLFHKFSTGCFELQILSHKHLTLFSTVSTGRSTQKIFNT
ncbi:hypothetical protein IQ270_19985, partial [Microcoleus sp. LEGE 07076]|uniref:hypothetical protein n=1 Tax=Microcoleus sp. LEGE 07076 TaxID=915322 RepID=UPI0019F9A1E6